MTRFTFGIHEDPQDPDRELRAIAGSLVVNAETRRFSHGPLDAHNHHAKLYYVRDVAREVFYRLKSVIPNIVVSPTGKAESSSQAVFDPGRLVKRIVNDIVEGRPTWNVLRHTDRKHFINPKSLENLYETVLRNAVNRCAELFLTKLSMYFRQAIESKKSRIELHMNEGDVKGAYMFGFARLLDEAMSHDKKEWDYKIEPASGDFDYKVVFMRKVE